jgi:predicted nucleic acid-binding protein
VSPVLPVLLDTSAFVASLDLRDPRHKLCKATIEQMPAPLFTCEAVITECCYMLRNIPGAVQAVLANIEQGQIRLSFDLASSATEVAALMRKYRDTPADFADACLIQMADDLNTGEILTLDSDFRHYRWRKSKAFRLLIPLE